METVNVRIPRSLWQVIVEIAEGEHRSATAEMVHLLLKAAEAEMARRQA
jgi:hypothetical protein